MVGPDATALPAAIQLATGEVLERELLQPVEADGAPHRGVGRGGLTALGRERPVDALEGRGVVLGDLIEFAAVEPRAAGDGRRGAMPGARRLA